jgi:hypothetical protein
LIRQANKHKSQTAKSTSYRRKPVPGGIEKYAIADLGWIPDQSWNDEIQVFSSRINNKKFRLSL